MRDDDQPENVRGRLIAIAIYIALSIGLYFVLAPTITNQDQLQSDLETAGRWGGIISYVVLYAAQLFIPWLPGSPLEVIGGATFGFWETIGLSTLSGSISGMFIYWLVKRIGLEQIVARFPDLLDSPWRLVKIIKKQKWSLVAVNMLTGDVAYFIAGAAKTPALFTAILLAVMRIPTVAMWTAVGAGIISGAMRQQLDQLVTVATIGTVGALLIGFLIARRYLPDWLEQLEARANNNTVSETQDE